MAPFSVRVDDLFRPAPLITCTRNPDKVACVAIRGNTQTDELARRIDEQLPGVRWTVGMTVERMVAALKRELKEG